MDKNLFLSRFGKTPSLSRTKIELFVQCPRCFYLDRKLGVSRPSLPGFTLNSAVDALLKKEFDIHRANGQPHPLMKNYKIDAIPFSHEMMDQWRHNFTGVRYFYEPGGFEVFGAVDDLWINSKGEIHVVDYKSTSTAEEVTLEGKYKDAYKRQAEIYQWLLRKNGFSVSDLAYFVYANGKKDLKAFDGRLEFDVSIIPYKADDSWVEGKLSQIIKCLKSNNIPKSASDCEYCLFVEKTNSVVDFGEKRSENLKNK